MALHRILVTGGAGFVGAHLLPALQQRFPQAVVADASLHSRPMAGVETQTLDVTDREAVTQLIRTFRPTLFLHLAAIANFGAASSDSGAVWRVNLGGTLNCAEGVLAEAPECGFLFVSSAEVYGLSCSKHDPIGEDAVLAPTNIYAASKAAADIAVGELCEQGLRAVRMRPFNHTGAGQSEALFVGAVAAQIARAEAGLHEPVVRVGQLDVERDFLDVEDVVDCYVSALDRLPELAAGTIFNVASGTARRMDDILAALLSRARIPISIEQEPARFRPIKVPRIRGDATRARDLLGWQPSRSWDDTLDRALAGWRKAVAADA